MSSNLTLSATTFINNMQLSTPVAALPGATKRIAEPLQALGIETVKDLIFYFPFRYDDFTKVVAISDAVPGEQVTIVATVAKFGQKKSWRRRIMMSEAAIGDETGKLTALWFHMPYIAKKIAVGKTYRFSGKVTETKYGPRMVNPLFEEAEVAEVDPSSRPTGSSKFLPVYPLTQGISQYALRRLIRSCRPAFAAVIDCLSPDIRERFGLIDLRSAVRAAHFPADRAEMDAARRRLGFDEMLRLQLSVGRMKKLRMAQSAPVVPFDETAVKAFVGRLPFTLTDDQRRATWEILQDMGRGAPMHRLLDGDVGSGKTAVAAVAARNVAAAGFQSAVMAPTEILAKQHFDTFTGLFAGEDVTVALWTNGYKRSSRNGQEILCAGKRECEALGKEIAEGRVPIVIGTHALIEAGLSFDRLALAVIDEQHRFGVRTRQVLCEKGGMDGMEPHLLSMTATPIPRSLALTVYGDLDLSLLREKPKDRLPVVTKVVTKTGRARTYAFIREQLAEGRQAFVICPCIEESDFLGVASVTEEFAALAAGELKGVAMAMLHGKMTAKEKESVMKDFAVGRSKVLVSTSVVEVGVDVPNATLMCIEGAERFGLAQLHQFRGRIGRGTHASHCFLFPSEASGAKNKRLLVMETTSDGFTLAERDLELRGSGDILGTAQSGLPEFRMASFGDARLIADVRQVTEEIIARGGFEKNPLLRDLLAAGTGKVHLE